MQFSTVSTTGVYPISLAEAKEWIKVEYTADDTLLQFLINASIQEAEKRTGLCFVNKSVKVSFNNTDEYYALPYQNSVITITRVGLTEIFGGSRSQKDLIIDDDYLLLEGYRTELSQIHFTTSNFSLIVEADVTAVEFPDPVKKACLQLIAENFENRSISQDGRLAKVPEGADKIFEMYRAWSL